jgi:hypothetical protein
MLPVNHSYLSSGVTLLTGAASTLGKVNGLKLEVNTYFGKPAIKLFQKQNFCIPSKMGLFHALSTHFTSL